MTTETLMTEAATTTEGQAASQAATTQTEAGTTAEGEQAAATQQQTTEGQKTEGQQAEGTKTEGETENKPQGAPEKYDFKTPEGREFDAQVIEQFSEVAKELNLSQDDAQKVIDKIAPALAQKQEKAMQEARNSWAESAKADKEFGGEKLDENLALAKQALDTFGSPALRTLLNESGLGNHPELIRAFYRAGKAISEDRFVGGKQGQAPQTVAQRMYPNMNP